MGFLDKLKGKKPLTDQEIATHAQALFDSGFIATFTTVTVEQGPRAATLWAEKRIREVAPQASSDDVQRIFDAQQAKRKQWQSQLARDAGPAMERIELLKLAADLNRRIAAQNGQEQADDLTGHMTQTYVDAMDDARVTKQLAFYKDMVARQTVSEKLDDAIARKDIDAVRRYNAEMEAFDKSG